LVNELTTANAPQALIDAARALHAEDIPFVAAVGHITWYVNWTADVQDGEQVR